MATRGTMSIDGSIHSAPVPNTVPIVLDNSVDVSMETYAGGSLFPRGFIVDFDGVLSIVNLNNTVSNITVIKGLMYPIAVKRFRVTGTTVGMTGTALN